MEIITANLSGKARRVTWNGRAYYVAPATMIREGVLNGSAGALYYPRSEIARDPSAWNGMPLTVGHPEVGGEHVSARQPDILEKIGVGHVFNVTANDDGKLSGEAWVDVERARQLDPRILSALEKGAPLEISTGLFTTNLPAPEGATYNGKPYEYVARDYRPDHLALLLDEAGACSVRDGCGLNVNAEGAGVVKRFLDWITGSGKTKPPVQVGNTEGGETVYDRKKAITWLTTNCECWKKDGAALEKLTDAQLGDLQANAERAAKLVLIVNKLKAKPTRNQDEGGESEGEVGGVDIASLAEFLGITEDPASDPVAFIEALKMKLDAVTAQLGGASVPVEPLPEEEVGNIVHGDDCTGADNDDPECRAMFAKVGNRKGPVANRTRQPAASRLTAEEQEDLAWARRMKTQEKQALVTRLTANVSDANQRRRKVAFLTAKPLGELRELADLLPPAPEPEYGAPPVVNYFGAAGGAPHLQPPDDSDNTLPVFEVDFSEMASPNLRRKA